MNSFNFMFDLTVSVLIRKVLSAFDSNVPINTSLSVISAVGLMWF